MSTPINKSALILAFINHFYSTHGHFPVGKDIMKAVPVGRAMIYKYLDMLEEQKLIIRHPVHRMIISTVSSNILPLSSHGRKRTGSKK